ncbi:MAG: acetate--CoA ligase family protein [Rhodobacteraceae bacterium]|nr:acetate--CoA ligase family protein [Paracoccaceae bacterium]
MGGTARTNSLEAVTMETIDQAGVLRHAFFPERAAIVGASTDINKFGGRAMHFCLTRGYQGTLWPINAKADEVQGVPAFRSLRDLPQAPDIAVIAVPAPLVRDTLAEAADVGAKLAIVYGAQFAEAGEEGRAEQRRLLDIARGAGMRMIGPNCMGVISLASGFVASFTTAPQHHDGKGWPEIGTVSVASQSGAVGIQMFAQLRDRGLGLANWISTGNQADIDVADAIAYFADDEATRTIAVYMEDASRGVKLARALEKARQARKPVVVLKVGTTPQGGVAAAGHTASLYVEDRVVDDLFRQYGVLRARTINELIDLVAAANAGKVPASRDVAAISVSGGGAVMITDAAVRHGLNLPDWDRDAVAALKETNSFVNDRNPIDVSAPSMSNMAITGGHLRWGQERGLPTMLGYISHIPLVPRTRKEIVPQLLAMPAAHPDQLVAVAMNALPEDRKALVQAGMAVFDDPVVATEAVGKLVHAGRVFAHDATAPAGSEAQAALAGDALNDWLAGAGIPLTPVIPVADADDAVARADAAGGPVVLKLQGADLAHRSDIGGVRLNLRGSDAVRAAHAELAARAADRSWSITLSPMVEGGVEALLAVRHDPFFGPLLMLGTGGVFVELFGDVAFRKLPFTRADAEDMLDRLKLSHLLDGFRGAPRADRAALLDAMMALSDACARGSVPAFEINPLMVLPEGRGLIGVDLLPGVPE